VAAIVKIPSTLRNAQQ